MCARLIGFCILVIVKHVKFKKCRVGSFGFSDSGLFEPHICMKYCTVQDGGEATYNSPACTLEQNRKEVKFLGLVRKSVFV